MTFRTFANIVSWLQYKLSSQCKRFNIPAPTSHIRRLPKVKDLTDKLIKRQSDSISIGTGSRKQWFNMQSRLETDLRHDQKLQVDEACLNHDC